jgi:hypothetical protein
MFDLRVIHRRRRTGFEDSKEFPIRKNDLIAGRYQVGVSVQWAVQEEVGSATGQGRIGLLCTALWVERQTCL